jgi:hypothetical protein
MSAGYTAVQARMPRSRKPTATGLRPSDLFEQRIHRICELLEGPEAEVTWDDRISDPDQPSRSRQIDVTVKRDGRVTLIECRLHGRPQNVKWIEELIGRRQSLGADTVVAVSASGFTKGAIAKAKRHLVSVRDLRELSDEEVREWGRSVALTLYFLAYSGVVVTLTFSTESLKRIDMAELHDEFTRRHLFTSMFNASAKLVGQTLISASKDENLILTFGFRLELDSLALCGEPVLDFAVKGKAKLVSRQLSARVLGYGAPSQEALRRDAIVEHCPLGETAIVHDGYRISTHLDLSALQLPPLHQFRYAKVVGQGETLDHEVFSVSGPDALQVRHGMIDMELVSYC